MKNYIGIDNGVSGSIGVITEDNKKHFIKTPVKYCLNYQKTKEKHINRIDVEKLKSFFNEIAVQSGEGYVSEFFKNSMTLIERPMVNPKRWEATLSAIRSLEATLICLEELDMPYQYIDSKNWQKEFFPKILNEGTDLKGISLEMGLRLFPEFKDLKPKHPDRDSLFMAEYGRRKGL